MEDYVMDLMQFVKKPAVVETFVDVLLCAVPIWLAIMIGVVIGWSWTPRWTSLVFLGLRSKISRFAWTAPPGFGGRRLWLAFTALSAFSVGRRLWSMFRGRRKRKNSDFPAPAPAVAAAAADGDDNGDTSATSPVDSAQYVDGNCCDINIVTSGGDHDIVTENDLEHLLHLLDSKKDDMAWQSMMERSTTDLACQGWRYEAETGPIMYGTRTIFEDASPELVRDFFWDDEFRPKWDPMLTHIKILEECPRTGAMIVHWIKKFPFFCSDREYIIGRKIWEAGKAYYCVTKGVPYPALQKRDKPRRVDLYFSSWVIRPVLSRKGDGQLSSCEVILVHYEDMGIPRDMAKLGVRHGMWGTVKKLHAGFRAYQQARKLEASLSRCALMARITTKISFGGSTDLPEPTSDEPTSDEQEPTRVNNIERVKDDGGIDWRWVVIGGVVAVACGLQTGAIGKGLLMGAAQRFARRR